MIGNRIHFKHYKDYRIDNKGEILEGLVVDAFTKVTGKTTGSASNFLGFGEGSVSGNTNSNRMYKVEFYELWDTNKKHLMYEDIDARMLVKIVSFAGVTNQEVNEEKIQIK